MKLENLVGKQVKIQLIEDRTVTGKLVEFDNYALTLELVKDTPRLIWKHAIIYLELDKEK